MNAVESSKSLNDDYIEDYYEKYKENNGNESKFVVESVSPDVMISATQVPPIYVSSHIQVPFTLDTSSSREDNLPLWLIIVLQ